MSDPEVVTCQEIVELVTDYLEGALDPATRRRFEEHVAVCDACTEYIEQLRETIRVTGTVVVDDLTPEVEAALLDAFRGWRRESAAIAPPGG